MTDDNVYAEISFTSQIRFVIVRAIAEQAISGINWTKICAEQMAANNITPQEVEHEIQRLNTERISPGDDIWKNNAKAGRQAWRQGQLTDAEKFWSIAVKEAEKVGPKNDYLGTSLYNLALVMHHQGRDAEAEQLLKRALTIVEKRLGPDNPDVAEILHILAELHFLESRYEEAEPLYKRATYIREKSSDPGMPTSLGMLAAVCMKQGKYKEAEAAYKRSLAHAEKILGSNNIGIVQELNALSKVYETQGKYAEAVPLYERTLTIWENVVGAPVSTHIATSLKNCARVLHKINREEDAVKLEARAKALE